MKKSNIIKSIIFVIAILIGSITINNNSNTVNAVSRKGVGFTIAATFPDVNMQRAVVKQLGVADENVFLTREMLDSATFIQFQDYGIEDVSGIELFTKVTTLYLAGNNLTTLPDNFCNGFSSLNTLVLAYNQLTDFPTSCETKLPNLTYISLNHNNLSVIPATLFKLPKLRILYLFNNNLTEIPNEISTLTSLRTINVSNNDLKVFPTQLQLPYLISLNVGYNKIKTLPADLSMFENLYFLGLEGNELTSIPEQLAGFDFTSKTSEVTYDFDNNHISSIPAVFTDKMNTKLDIRAADQTITLDPIKWSKSIEIANTIKTYTNEIIAPAVIDTNGIYSNNTVVWSGLDNKAQTVTYTFRTELPNSAANPTPTNDYTFFSGTVIIPVTYNENPGAEVLVPDKEITGENATNLPKTGSELLTLSTIILTLSATTLFAYRVRENK